MNMNKKKRKGKFMLDLQLSSLEGMYIDSIDESSIEQMWMDEQELANDLAECKSSIETVDLLVSIADAVDKHGTYAGFESLLTADSRRELNTVLGFDICSAESMIGDVYSSEILRDSINKFFAKIRAALGRVGDRFSNFIKTTLPYKEKYLKEMTLLKQALNGMSINDETFGNKKVSSALTKVQFNDITGKRKQHLAALLKACSDSKLDNIDAFLKSMDGMDYERTSLGSITFRPWLTWFKKGQVSTLGWNASDVVKVIDTVIAEIKSIEELNTMFAKMNEQINRLFTQISQDRAVGNVDDAIAKRVNVANLQSFFFQLCEAAYMHEILIRREMYFATYLARAAKQSAN